MNSKNFIEINGKFYDTVSGKLITESLSATEASTPAPAAVKPVEHLRASGAAAQSTPAQIIHARLQHAATHHASAGQRPIRPAASANAVQPLQKPTPETYHASRNSTHAHQVHHKAQPTQILAKTHDKPAHTTHVPTHHASHSVAVHHAPHKQQSSQTLMRRAVAKPQASLKHRLHVQGTLAHATPSLIVKKTSAYSVVPERVERAHTTPKSEHISRFEEPKPYVTPQERVTKIPVAIAPVPVTPAPDDPKPGVPTEAGAPSPAPTNKPADMFEQAIQNASHFVDTKTHARGFRKKRRQQVLSIASAALALVVIAGFALYLNSPGLQFKVASARVGVSTHLPNLQASGFAYGGVRAGHGTLTLGLKNGDKTAQLVQQATNWSDEDLLSQANVGTDASGQPLYKTIDADGTTVYRFNDSSATWIKNGVWYQLSSTDPLSNSQIQAVAQNS